MGITPRTANEYYDIYGIKLPEPKKTIQPS